MRACVRIVVQSQTEPCLDSSPVFEAMKNGTEPAPRRPSQALGRFVILAVDPSATRHMLNTKRGILYSERHDSHSMQAAHPAICHSDAWCWHICVAFNNEVCFTSLIVYKVVFLRQFKVHVHSFHEDRWVGYGFLRRDEPRLLTSSHGDVVSKGNLYTREAFDVPRVLNSP